MKRPQSATITSRLLFSSYRIFTFFSHTLIVLPAPISSLIVLFSILFSVFAFSNLPLLLSWSMFTYNLIELHLIPKILGSQNNNADQLGSQFVTSVQAITAKIVSVDCICDRSLAIKRKVLLPANK